MKALTLHQPWASLVALLVKRIETRSWSTKYRGRLYIHAGLRQPRHGFTIGDWRTYAADARSAPRAEPARMYHRAPGWATRPETPFLLPLGAIVASCELVDVVPTEALCWTNAWPGWRLLQVMDNDPGPSPLVGNAQRPYGDFTPGRYAWLLDDIKPVDPPVPCRGWQGLW